MFSETAPHWTILIFTFSSIVSQWVMVIYSESFMKGIQAMTFESDDRIARLAHEPLRNIAAPNGVFKGTKESIRDLWNRRDLLILLVKREIRAKYKDSVLGLVWSLARPLVQLLIYYLVIGRFLGAARSIPNFAIFVFAGLTIWTLFNEIVAGGTSSIVANSGLIKKIRLPREVFPLASTGSALFNCGIQFIILVIAVPLFAGFPSGGNWVELPLALLIVTVWGTALALILSAGNVYLRDIQYLVEVALMIAFWASPIVYSWNMVQNAVGPTAREFFLMNPITLAVLGMQSVFWNSGPANSSAILFPADLVTRMVIALAIGLVALFFAQRAFSRMQRDFAQEM